MKAPATLASSRQIRLDTLVVLQTLGNRGGVVESLLHSRYRLQPRDCWAAELGPWMQTWSRLLTPMSAGLQAGPWLLARPAKRTRIRQE